MVPFVALLQESSKLRLPIPLLRPDRRSLRLERWPLEFPGSPMILEGHKNTLKKDFSQKSQPISHLRTLLRMLCRNIFAILAPVAVVYEGGGVYLGGTSSGIIGVTGTSKGIVERAGEEIVSAVRRLSEAAACLLLASISGR